LQALQEGILNSLDCSDSIEHLNLGERVFSTIELYNYKGSP
jgi:hypothetical protein